MAMVNKRHKRWKLVLCALAGFALCLGAQRFSYNWLETHKKIFVAPLGLENTLIRMQGAHKLQGDVVMLGSSITERFKSSSQTAVVGIPGSSFLAGLALLEDVAEFPPGTVYVLEMNNMYKGIYEDVLQDSRKWDFKLFRDSAHLSIAAKPSNLLLNWVDYFARPMVEYAPCDCSGVAVQEPEDLSAVPAISKDELSESRDIIAGIESIRRKGAKVCFVRIPVESAQGYQEPYEKACRLARHLDIPVLNYNTDAWHARLVFTDASHLDSRHAATVLFRDVISRDAKRCGK